MFELAGEGVAMANALDSVKATADTVIGDHADDGVARFLEERFELPRPG
jgi:hydroxymethylpyrimidine pyrophosphatase-like HAD family hydrolase